MKSRVFVSLLFCMSFCIAAIGQKTSIDKHVSVKFPSKPNKVDAGNGIAQVAKNDDYSIVVFFRDLGKKFDDTNAMFDGVVDGTLQGAKNSHLEKSENVTVDKYPGRQFQYTYDSETIKGVVVTMQVFLIEERLYVFDFRDLKAAGIDKTIGKDFFDSIAVK